MRINEVKVMKEVVTNTQYIAEDGMIFYNREECEKYEQSALFTISKQLKKLNPKDVSAYDLFDEGSEEDYLDIYDVPTEKDLELLKRFIYLTLQKHNVSEANIESYFNDNKMTAGHEIIIHWYYDNDGFWIVGDGSFNAILDRIRDNYRRCLMTKEEIKAEREAKQNAQN